jgi:DNA-binding PadR family transcriptional regulator
VRVKRELEPGEWAVLAVLHEEPRHGYAVAALFAPEGEIGRVWSYKRPMVYATMRTLERRELIRAAHAERAAGKPQRTIYEPTAKGRADVEAWLGEPVGHVRDLRSALILKLLFRHRLGLPLEPLLEAQRHLLQPLESALQERAADARGFERLLALWRLETTVAALRFLEDAAAAPIGSSSD